MENNPVEETGMPPPQLRLSGADVGVVLQLLRDKEKTIQELSKRIEKLCSTIESQTKMIRELQRPKRQYPNDVTSADAENKRNKHETKEIKPIQHPKSKETELFYQNRYKILQDEDAYQDAPMDEDPTQLLEDRTTQNQGKTILNKNKSKTTPTEQTQNKDQIQRETPPIILRKKESWLNLSSRMKERKINYLKAETISDGIKIKPNTSDDYRNTVNLLDEMKLEYHTYQLPEEKSLHIVIRGIPECINTEEVENDLIEKGFHPEKVHRMRNGRTKAPIPLVLVLLPRIDKDIFEIKEVLRLKVKIETLRPKTSISQCHNCQKFGHSQSHCRANPLCVKCGKGHKTVDCLLTKEEKATCANCKGEHPASYKGCPAYPRQQQSRNASATQTSYTSYSEAARGNNYKQSTEDMYQKMVNMFKQFETMMANMLNQTSDNHNTHKK